MGWIRSRASAQVIAAIQHRGFYGIDNSLVWVTSLMPTGARFSMLTIRQEHANESPIVLRRNEVALTAAVIWTF